MPPDKATEEERLRRLGGGRWQTRDERFTIEPQSGTWAVVDAEETDDLGLPRVRGPFRSLTDAKAAIATARTSDAPASPLAERLERRRGQPPSGKRPPEQKPAAGRGHGCGEPSQAWAGEWERTVGGQQRGQEKCRHPERSAQLCRGVQGARGGAL